MTWAMPSWRRRKRELAGQHETAPLTNTDQGDLRMDLSRLFSQLSVNERQLIWLAHVEGLDHFSIGRALNVSEASASIYPLRTH